MTREELINLSRNKEELNISFKDFQKVFMLFNFEILSDYQIKSRDKYLKNFRHIFKKIDSDNNGIINEEEFVALISALNVYREDPEENTTRLLNIVDPYNNQQITYSDVVSLFSMVSLEFNSKEQILDEDGKTRITLLDKICLNENLLDQ